jgi:hypothetical protein
MEKNIYNIISIPLLQDIVNKSQAQREVRDDGETFYDIIPVPLSD